MTYICGKEKPFSNDVNTRSFFFLVIYLLLFFGELPKKIAITEAQCFRCVCHKGRGAGLNGLLVMLGTKNSCSAMVGLGFQLESQ